MNLTIRGSGVAAMSCAHLLGRAGIAADLVPVHRPSVPAVMLSDPALALLRDVLALPDLFADKPRIDRRIVAWGGAEALSLPHGAVVVSEADLDAALALPSAAIARADMTLHTAAPFPAGTLRRFGARTAGTAAVTLRFPEDRSACWIEAVREGWLFLIPAGEGDAAWLLGIGASIERLVALSRHVAARLDQVNIASAQFEVCPRILTSLQGEDWLACGTAAIAFDPICGDGTAQALREAVLAAAVITAWRDGGDPAALRTHYESMLIATMRRHLRLCADFYRSGGTGPWWDAQMASLADGFDWCTARLATLPEPRYQLQDFRLVERETVI
ncbi:hypothetical protein [Sphingobium nicotianae]|uniref:Uncharacterized protein n=1 Tax=Sphingobium nicotianae TaxID=2782607 RepID=A0A9X1DBW4_9SPHN|nr:hypothetical protein [Sphingobium nicotianae]MBT2187277.1 hypothetical protein [Sphingobium nicotianae]